LLGSAEDLGEIGSLLGLTVSGGSGLISLGQEASTLLNPSNWVDWLERGALMAFGAILIIIGVVKLSGRGGGRQEENITIQEPSGQDEHVTEYKQASKSQTRDSGKAAGGSSGGGTKADSSGTSPEFRQTFMGEAAEGAEVAAA
jgi:hypothetical protein